MEQSVYQPNQVFDQVASRVGEVLAKREFKRTGATVTEEDGLSAVFLKEGELAYQIYLNNEKKQFLLRYCDAEEGQPDEKWRTRSLLLFEPEDESQVKREIESVINDFSEEIAGPSTASAVLTQVQKRRHNKDEENTTDPIFFFNRLVPLCDGLREDLLEERIKYGEVRAATFAKEKVLPRLHELLQSKKPSDFEKLGEILSDMYDVGDLDVRSVITIILVNGFTQEEYRALEPHFTDDMKKATKAGLKRKGKTSRPEKAKKAKKYVADNLNATR